MRAFRRMTIAGATLIAGLAWTSAASAQISLLEIERHFPECSGMFTQAHIDDLARATENPEEVFRRWARRRLTMIEEPPPIPCKSKIWRWMHGVRSNAAAEREAVVAALLRDPVSAIFRSSVQIGTNEPVAGGVHEAQSETTIAVNPKNPLQLVGGANTYYFDPASECQAPAGATYGTQALYGSFDGGQTWSYRCAPWHPAVTGGVPGAAYWFGSDPAVAWDAEGRAYAAYMLISMNEAGTSAGSAIVISRSTDSGLSWSPWSVVANSIANPNKYHDKEMIAVDTSSGGAYSHPGRVYVIWGENNVERVAWSDDGAQWHLKSFGTSPVPKYHVGGNIAVGPDGAVYAVWNRVFDVNDKKQALAPDQTWFSKSIDGGDTWSEPVKIFDHARGSFEEYYLPMAQDHRWVNVFASIDVNRNPESPWYGRIHLAWADVTSPCCPKSPYGPIDVYSAWSKDGGDSWSKPVRVNDDEDGASHILPWLAVDQSDGTVHIAWYDTRNDTALGEQTQVYAARSSDGGVSFEGNMSLTDKGTSFANEVGFSNENLRTNLHARPDQYGDYMGIAAANRQVYALATDSRPFFPELTSRREDAVLSTATYCSRPRWLPGPVPGVPASAIGSIDVTLPGLLSWGINATGGTTRLLRYDGADCAGTPAEIDVRAGTTQATDAPPAAGTYSYKVRVRNDCPGTALTPMSSVSVCSAPVSFTP